MCRNCLGSTYRRNLSMNSSVSRARSSAAHDRDSPCTRTLLCRARSRSAGRCAAPRRWHTRPDTPACAAPLPRVSFLLCVPSPPARRAGSSNTSVSCKRPVGAGTVGRTSKSARAARENAPSVGRMEGYALRLSVSAALERIWKSALRLGVSAALVDPRTLYATHQEFSPSAHHAESGFARAPVR
jgi:hypothetical protein